MIMGISGGAVIPPLMGLMTDIIGSQAGSLSVITMCLVYLGYCAHRLGRKPARMSETGVGS